MLAALAALAAVAASAQPYQLARPLSTEFLARLAQHGLLPSQVAIINASVGSVIILDREASNSVVFIDGADNFVWAQIAEQLSESAAEGRPMHVTVNRRFIDVASCSVMIEPRTEFLARLDVFDPKATHTSSAATLQMVIVDATDYRIITSGRDGGATIKPNGPMDPPLQQAAGRLHSAVSRCAGSVISEVQQHDF